MKRLIPIIFLIFICDLSYSQVRIGAKVGLHSHTLKVLGDERLDQRIQNASFAYHIGLDLKAQLGSITILPSLILNRVQANYIESLNSDAILSISQYNAEIPLLIGFRCSIINLYGGLSSMFRLGGNQQYKGLENLRGRYIPSTLSGQLGARINVKKLFIECKYDQNLFSYKPLLNGTPIQLIDSYSRIILSIGKYF